MTHVGQGVKEDARYEGRQAALKKQTRKQCLVAKMGSTRLAKSVWPKASVNSKRDGRNAQDFVLTLIMESAKATRQNVKKRAGLSDWSRFILAEPLWLGSAF